MLQQHLDFSPHRVVGVVHVEDCEEAEDGEVYYDVSGQC